MENRLEERIRNLEKRIQHQEDVKESRELMHTYCYTMDEGDWDGVMSCYARECSCNFGHFSHGGRDKGRSGNLLPERSDVHVCRLYSPGYE